MVIEQKNPNITCFNVPTIIISHGCGRLPDQRNVAFVRIVDDALDGWEILSDATRIAGSIV